MLSRLSRGLALTLSFMLNPYLSPTGLAFDQQHRAWEQVLLNYQDAAGRLDYAQLKKDSSGSASHPLRIYLEGITGVNRAQFGRWSRDARMAFLINAYNALTVKLVVDHFPVASIKDIGGFLTKPWDVEFFSLLEGAIQTLDQIEHKNLRPLFKDFRVHAALHCAALSCPPLRHEPFVVGRLEPQLDQQMRRWLADTGHNRFNPETGLITISKIFSWYEDDFSSWGGGVKGVLAQYGPADARKALSRKGRIEFTNYDWRVNAKGVSGRRES